MGSEEQEQDLEELVLKESIVSATGIGSGSLQVGIKGDPSLRETALFRAKYPSVIDDIYPQIRDRLAELLLERSTYRIYIGFNSSEIRTNSIFDPLREETHTAERFLDPTYLDRHFPRISYEEKVQAMRDIYRFLREGTLFELLPEHWKRITVKRSLSWQPLDRHEIPTIMSTLKVLRDMPEYYLRNVSVCIIQNLVRMQFNCDGTQLVNANNYRKFLEENVPAQE
jgi:hypothetical protein